MMTENIAHAEAPANTDWHSAFIVYQLRLNGLSLRKLAALHGYSSGSFGNVAKKPRGTAERIIAEALGVTPQTIWPSRFNPDGTRRVGLIRYDKAKYLARKAAGKITPASREKHAEYKRRARARIMADPQKREAYVEKRRAERRASYQRNRAKILEAYHADKSKARAYYEANRERILASAKAYKKARKARPESNSSFDPSRRTETSQQQ